MVTAKRSSTKAPIKTQAKKRSVWAPDRQDIIWIDCNPEVGQKMRDIHPFLVLSPRIFNEKTSLVVGLLMTTAAYNADKAIFYIAPGRLVELDGA